MNIEHYFVLVIISTLFCFLEVECENYDSHKNWHYLNNQCGESVQDRIIGGEKASMGQFPWLARIGTSLFETNPSFFCGGSLINPSYVLSAAHCFSQQNPNVFTIVRLGEWNTDSDPDCDGDECAPRVQDQVVTKITLHEQYDSIPFKNDIALLLLENPIKISEYVSPICLPKSNTLDKNYLSTSMQVAGWGYTNKKTMTIPTTLMYISLPVVPLKKCVNLYKGYTHVDDNQICVGGEKDRDSCAGDSGGPLMLVYTDKGSSPRYHLMGVVSFGPDGCGDKDSPAVYTFIPKYMNWVLDHLEK